MRTSHTRHLALTGVIALGALIALPVQAASVAEIANYSKSDRAKMLEAGAKKEGAVLFYTVGTQTAPMMKRFRDKYPFIKLDVYRARSDDLVRRTLEESKANRNTVDAFGSNVGAIGILRDAGLIQPFTTPELKNYKSEAIEKGRNWTVDYASYLNYAWNTKVAPEAGSIKTYDDLLDPKWKNRMTISGWVSTSAKWVGVLVLTKGEDYVRKLGKQNLTVYEASPKAVANLIVSGEAPISPIIYSSHVANSKRKGATVEWRSLGTAFANNGGVAIAKHAPHPHAAMMLIDFMLSLEGQKMRQTMGYYTLRKDMTNRDAPDKYMDITERPNYVKEYEYWSRLTAKTFGKGKKLAKKKKK